MNSQNHPAIYLALPYSHVNPHVRQARADEANALAAKLINLGVAVFSPISAGHAICQALPGSIHFGWETFAATDRAMMRAVSSEGGAIVLMMLDGHEASVGVAAELQYAKQIGLPLVRYQPSDTVEALVASIKAVCRG